MNEWYEPMWEFYDDFTPDLGNFTIFTLDAGWEASTFTFHIALLGFHFGRSLKMRI